MSSLVADLYANSSVTPISRADGGSFVLESGDVHVWSFGYDSADSDSLQRVVTILSDEEHRAAARLVRVEDERRYRLSHSFVRCVLSHYDALSSPSALCFERNSWGKPRLTSPVEHALEFSLSHTIDHALLAVTKGNPVGIDVESLDRGLDPVSLGTVALAPDERNLVASAPEAQRLRSFLRFWCRKEACLKAVGIGLINNLPDLSVVPDRVELNSRHDERLSLESPRLVFLHDLVLPLNQSHVGALATTQPCLPVAMVPSLCRWPIALEF